MQTRPATLTASLMIAAASASSQATPPDYGFDFVTIGDAGNLGWNRDEPTGTFLGRGAVDYEYRISEREVETRDWLEFSNTFSSQSDELADLIGRPGRWGAIRDSSYDGPGERFVLRTDLPSPERQYIRVSWRQAALFVNWLHNGKSSDPSAIMNGAYDVSTFGLLPDGITHTDQETHNPDARFWIPTTDEWTKAGHWDPNKNGPGDGGWWIYNHGSDVPPVTGLPGETGAQTAAIDLVANPDLINQLELFGDIPNGSYPETRSPWGLIDMTGGAAEWFEDYSFGLNLTRRYSGSENAGSVDADIAFFLNGARPTAQRASFRIASVVPTPGVGVPLLTLAALTSRRRR